MMVTDSWFRIQPGRVIKGRVVGEKSKEMWAGDEQKLRESLREQEKEWGSRKKRNDAWMKRVFCPYILWIKFISYQYFVWAFNQCWNLNTDF